MWNAVGRRAALRRLSTAVSTEPLSRRKLGDLEVSCIGLGASTLSTGHTTEEVAVKTIHQALACGINFFDTALNIKGVGESGVNERLVASAVKSYQGNLEFPVLIATKGGFELSDSNETKFNGSPSFLKESCEKSLTNLGVEALDLYHLQVNDEKASIEEAVNALKDLKEQGLIKRIGLANVTKPQLEEARKITEIVSVQNFMNILRRDDLENGLLDYCQSKNIAFIPQSPLGGRPISKKIMKNFDLLQLSHKHMCSIPEVCLAWLLLPPHTIPIPGCATPEIVVSCVNAATDVEFDVHDLEDFAKVYAEL